MSQIHMIHGLVNIASCLLWFLTLLHPVLDQRCHRSSSVTRPIVLALHFIRRGILSLRLSMLRSGSESSASRMPGCLPSPTLSFSFHHMHYVNFQPRARSSKK